MSFTKVSEDNRDLFAMKANKCAESIRSRSSRFRARQAKRMEVHNSVRKKASSLSYMYNDTIGYERAVLNIKIGSSKGSSAPAVQYRVIGYRKERICGTWFRGFLKSRESLERIGLETYASIDSTTERLIPLDPTGKKTGFPVPGPAASMNMLEIRPSRLRELYGEKLCLTKTDQEALNKTWKCLLVREREYAQLIQKLPGTGTGKFMRKKSKESKRLSGVPKGRDEKQRLILDMLQANCHFSKRNTRSFPILG